MPWLSFSSKDHQTGWTGLVAKLLTQSGEAEAAPEKAAAKTANV